MIFNSEHPRRCGENIAIIPPITATKGSPPQVRGKPYTLLQLASISGITPADAGKTGSVKLSVPVQRDHPRGCGENYRQALIF